MYPVVPCPLSLIASSLPSSRPPKTVSSWLAYSSIANKNIQHRVNRDALLHCQLAICHDSSVGSSSQHCANFFVQGGTRFQIERVELAEHLDIDPLL